MIDFSKYIKSLLIKELNRKFRQISKEMKFKNYLENNNLLVNGGEFTVNLSNQDDNIFYFSVILNKQFKYKIEYIDKENDCNFKFKLNEKEELLINEKLMSSIILYIKKVYVPKLVEDAITGIKFKEKNKEI